MQRDSRSAGGKRKRKESQGSLLLFTPGTRPLPFSVEPWRTSVVAATTTPALPRLVLGLVVRLAVPLELVAPPKRLAAPGDLTDEPALGRVDPDVLRQVGRFGKRRVATRVRARERTVTRVRSYTHTHTKRVSGFRESFSSPRGGNK